MFFLLGVIIVLLGLGFGMLLASGGNFAFLSDFTDIPSMLVVLFPLLGVLTATQSYRVFYKGLRAVIFPEEDITEDLRGRSASLFRLLSKTTVLVSIVNFFIHLILVLKGIDFGDSRFIISRIGPAMATTLITPLYGLTLIAAFFEPMVYCLKKRHTGKR